MWRRLSHPVFPPPGSSLPRSPRGGKWPHNGPQTEDSLRETQLGQRVYQHCIKAPEVRSLSVCSRLQEVGPLIPNPPPTFVWAAVCLPNRSKVGVFLCGPTQLGKSLQKQCLSHSEADVKFIFNKENFWRHQRHQRRRRSLRFHAISSDHKSAVVAQNWRNTLRFFFFFPHSSSLFLLRCREKRKTAERSLLHYWQCSKLQGGCKLSIKEHVWI